MSESRGLRSLPRRFLSLSLTLFLSLTGLASLNPAVAAVTVPVRVNANGTAFTDSAGKSWVADRAYSAGSYGYTLLYGTSSTSSPIAGTSDAALYQRMNLFTNNEGYKFDLANGTYQVTLKMAEEWATGAGQRKFDVKIEGTTVLTAFDIFAACGKLTACDRTFTTTVSDGQLNIQFNMNGGANYATVSGVEVTGGSGGGGDTQAPTAPTNLKASNITSNSAALSWTASTDNVGVTSYEIFRGSTSAGSSTNTSFTVTGLSASTTYSFTVKAKDAAGNISAASNSVSVTTLAPPSDTQAPTAPTNLTSTAKTNTTVSLSWTASTDNVGVTGYDIFRGSTNAGSSTSTSFTVTGLSPSTSYTFTVKAKDAAGNISAASNSLSVTTNANPPPPSSRRIIGYYTAWATYARNYQVSDIPANRVTHINYAFANIANGTCVLGDSYADIDKFFPGDTWDAGALRGNFNQLNKLKQANPGLKTLISVGGWTWSGNFSAIAATDAARTTFANGCVAFMKQYGFDGIDLDWEYPVSGGLQNGTAADKQNFTLLLQKMRQVLNAQGAADGKQYLLTIAAGAGPAFYDSNTEPNLYHQYLDWINLMTYDFHGGWDSTTNHNAALYATSTDPSPEPAKSKFNIDAAVNGFLAKGVPANKLNVGLPFYGRGYSNVTNASNGLFQPFSGLPTGTWEAGIFDYTHLVNDFISKNGYTRYWNSTARVPYLFNGSTFISYDDAQSMAEKTAYIKSRGLGGAMFWEFSGDRGGVLLNAVYNGLQ